MMRRVFVVLILLGARHLLAEEEPPGGIRIVREQQGDAVVVSIKSKYTREFVVSVEATLENMRSSRPIPFTVDSAGRNSFVLFRLEPIDKNRRWHYHYEPYWTVGARRTSTTNDADYAMPFGPGRYVVMQGPRGTFSHNAGTDSENAVDWTVPVGTIVCAAREGRVVGVKQDSDIGGPDRSFRPYANYVLIKHSDGTFAWYVHLQKDGAMVQVGDEVTTGQPIGLSGQTGFASKPHLHFMVFQAVDGKKLLSLPFRLKTDHGTFTEFIKGQAY